jgi:very-short-patch-repair endonuclease
MPYGKAPIRTKEQIEQARSSRKKSSVADDIVWEIARNRKFEFKFKCEFPIGPYRIDFYCDEAKLGLEMDGEQQDPVRDAVRDKYLGDLGILIFRIPNVEFFQLDPTAPFRDH